MKGIYKITILFLAVVFLAACSRKKNTFLSRNAHAVKAEFNALYHGNVAFEDGKDELARSFRDNFWEILPVERLDLDENAVLPGESKNPNFTRAEEKAAKAIQTHSIYLDREEYNPQIDEAYILLGKARYYDTRFVPALDAFNFILDRYPTSNNINHAKVWKAKANIRMNNEEGALEDLAEMMEEEELTDEDYADASAILAQAFISLDSLDGALPYIKQASETVKNNELKGRYLYIKGQLYNSLGFKDSANLSFDEVIELNRKSPRIYMINAYIAKARNFNYDNGDRVAFLELLRELEENRENRPFLDRIYNQIGDYYRNSDSIDTAITYYNKSIKAYRDDKIMQSVNYQTLAEINFDRAEYKNAGAYYDSTLTNLEEGTRQYRRIKKKLENLEDVIKYEDIAIQNDSILQLTNMSEAQQLTFFTAYTQRLKEKAIADSIANVRAEEDGVADNEFYKKKNKEEGKEKRGGKFYFYNPTTVAFGKQEFIKIWGKRKLEDNWRLSNKNTKLENLVEEENSVAIAENELFNPETYISRIPKDQKIIDSLAKERNFAYYQLGLIYKEKFKEYHLAANRLEKLLTFNPEERLILPSKYNLYKIYTELENSSLATQYKNDIITNHPNSRYAEILLNPNSLLATDESSPEYKYKELYEKFETTKYQEVIETCDLYINIYNGNDIVPKLELLKVTAIGRQKGFEPYKKGLNFVSLNYPNSEEGKEAQDLLITLIPKIANKEFYAETETDKWKVVYKFNSSDRENAEILKEKLDKAIEWYNYTNMSTSIDYYIPDTIFVIIHGINTKDGGRRFADVLNENKKYKIKETHFEISSLNYKIVQIHKNLEEFLNTDFSTITKEKGKEVNQGIIEARKKKLKILEEKKQNKNNEKADTMKEGDKIKEAKKKDIIKDDSNGTP